MLKSATLIKNASSICIRKNLETKLKRGSYSICNVGEILFEGEMTLSLPRLLQKAQH